MKIIYYLNKLIEKIKTDFSFYKIHRLGLGYSFYSLLVFFCHRSYSDFQWQLEYKKDSIMQKYLLENYDALIKKYSSKNFIEGKDGIKI